MPSLKLHLISCVIKYSVILIHAYAKVFAFAKQNAPAVIFIDEVDAFGMDRDGQSEPGLRLLFLACSSPAVPAATFVYTSHFVSVLAKMCILP
jgi:hypothetical protein